MNSDIYNAVRTANNTTKSAIDNLLSTGRLVEGERLQNNSYPLYLKFKDLLYLAITISLFICSFGLTKIFPIHNDLILLFSLSLTILLIVQFQIYRRTEKLIKIQNATHYLFYQQIEALFSIFAVIKPAIPLPSMTKWSISPDLSKIIIDTILKLQPATILELGSGTSTLVAGYILKQIGKGKIISLEHLREFAIANKQELKRHQLQDFAEIRETAIEQVNLNEEKWLWYDISTIEDLQSIDLLIVDGPPSYLQKMARYPALPILFSRLSDNAVIIVDDSNRKDEIAMVNLWLQHFNSFQYEVIPTQKITIILRKKSPSSFPQG